jgi:hypothetical protein
VKPSPCGRLASCAILAFGVCTFAGVKAAQIERVNIGPNIPEVITISGELELGDEKRFANMAVNISDAVVAFDSAGSNLVAGIEIGKVIRLKNFSPAVPANATCAFLIGLSQSEADRKHNLDLLNKKAWIDVQMLLRNKKLAKITFEKGPPGEKTMGDAFAQ